MLIPPIFPPSLPYSTFLHPALSLRRLRAWILIGFSQWGACRSQRVGQLVLSLHCRLHLKQQFLLVPINAFFLGLGHWAITFHWFPVASSPKVLSWLVSTAYSSINSTLLIFPEIPVWFCHHFLLIHMTTIIFAFANINIKLNYMKCLAQSLV